MLARDRSALSPHLAICEEDIEEVSDEPEVHQALSLKNTAKLFSDIKIHPKGAITEEEMENDIRTLQSMLNGQVRFCNAQTDRCIG